MPSRATRRSRPGPLLRPRRGALLIVAATIALLSTTAASANDVDAARGQNSVKTVAGVEVLGEVVVPSGTMFEETEIGGLSSISFDPARRLYYVLADDQGNRTDANGEPTGDPVRHYTIDIDLDDGTLDDGDVTFEAVTPLLDLRRRAFAPGGVDPEGLVVRGGSLYISSEGNTLSDPIIDPFIRRYNRQGRVVGQLPIPDHYLSNGTDRGVRFNLAFESLNLTPNGATLVTAAEGALFQDGPASTFENGSLARILEYRFGSRGASAEYVYEVEPWAEPSNIFGVNGIVEVLPIDNAGTMLVMERSFSVGGTLGGGTGNVVSIYEISTDGATDVLEIDALYEDGAPVELVPVSKRLVFEFDDLGVPIDNIEGMTFGPPLPDGRQTLMIVSDNNFSANQFTQFVALALDIVED
ncbi:MAG: esterase-like activity of phytase family protein [Acidimicrobiales bacterium]